MEESSARDERKRAALLEASSKRRKLSFCSPEEDEKKDRLMMTELLLASPPADSELRSRSALSQSAVTFVPPTLPAAEFCSGESRSSSCSCRVALSQFSSSHLEEERLHVAGDPEVKNFETETSTCINANLVFSRENSPSSSTENSMSTTMQTSPEKPRAESGLVESTTAVKMPPEAEIEEFFAEAEKYEQKRFIEKYNYDFVKDVPLEGRYQWVRLKP